MRQTFCLLALLTGFVLSPLRADTMQLTITPSNVTDVPGGTVYFGFSLSWQDDTNSLLVVNSYLANETNPLLGGYADLIGANGFNNILGPSTSGQIWIEAGGPGTGAGFYVLSFNAPIGDMNSGMIAVDYLILSDTGATGGTVEAPFSVTVTSAASAVPEPGTGGLLVASIAVAAGWRRMRRTRAAGRRGAAPA